MKSVREWRHDRKTKKEKIGKNGGGEGGKHFGMLDCG